MSRERVVITGAAGLLGRVLMRQLAESYSVRGLDRRGSGATVRRTQMTRLGQVVRACRDTDVVVDLAARPAVATPWRVVRRNNLPATWNALEAARRSGAQRVIFASSINVTGGYDQEEPYASVLAGRYADVWPDHIRRLTVRDPPRPNGAYAVGKLFGEAAARYYADRHDLSVLCLRLGAVNPTDRPTAAQHFANLLTFRDLAHLVRCCIEAPADRRFGTYYGISDNTWCLWDLEDARREIGYRPADNAERFRTAGSA